MKQILEELLRKWNYYQIYYHPKNSLSCLESFFQNLSFPTSLTQPVFLSPSEAVFICLISHMTPWSSCPTPTLLCHWVPISWAGTLSAVLSCNSVNYPGDVLMPWLPSLPSFGANVRRLEQGHGLPVLLSKSRLHYSSFPEKVLLCCLTYQNNLTMRIFCQTKQNISFVKGLQARNFEGEILTFCLSHSCSRILSITYLFRPAVPFWSTVLKFLLPLLLVRYSSYCWNLLPHFYFQDKNNTW